MSRTIPPIPPPLGANAGKPSTSNPNRVENIPIETTNTTTTTNDFTSWKVRFLVFLDGLEPYLLKTIKDGPFVPMSSLSTFDYPLPKRQNQCAKLQKRYGYDLILAHEGPSNTRDTKIAASRLKFNDFKSLEGKKVNGTLTRLKCLLNDLENNGVIIPQAEVNATFYNYEEGLIDQIYESETQRFTIQASSSKALISNNQFQDSDSNIQEALRRSNEFMANLNAEYHERALMENQKGFYKRGKYKGLKAEMTVLTKKIDALSKGKSKKGKGEKGLIAESFEWDEESISSEDEGTTKIKAFMEIVEDKPSVGKADARSGMTPRLRRKHEA
ncbi:hypothetical protein Tco_0599827 [Tanacetum coccineum]